jgi:hypothetical protein
VAKLSAIELARGLPLCSDEELLRVWEAALDLTLRCRRWD